MQKGLGNGAEEASGVRALTQLQGGVRPVLHLHPTLLFLTVAHEPLPLSVPQSSSTPRCFSCTRREPKCCLALGTLSFQHTRCWLAPASADPAGYGCWVRAGLLVVVFCTLESMLWQSVGVFHTRLSGESGWEVSNATGDSCSVRVRDVACSRTSHERCRQTALSIGRASAMRALPSPEARPFISLVNLDYILEGLCASTSP